MDRDESLAIAELSGWVEAPHYNGQKRDGMPVLQKGNALLWHHSQGVTVADSTGDGWSLSIKFRNHRYYRDLEEALNKEP